MNYQALCSDKRAKQIRLPRLNSSGQAVGIETSVALIAICTFILGVTLLFTGICRNIIDRQKEYKESRTELGKGGSDQGYNDQRLNVFRGGH